MSVSTVHKCSCYYGQRKPKWHRERGPDCMYAVCDHCGIGFDIGWGPNPRYFPEEQRRG